MELVKDCSVGLHWRNFCNSLTNLLTFINNVIQKNVTTSEVRDNEVDYFLKKVVCLANSRKTYGRCVAGKEILDGGSIGSWIRPVSSRPSEEIWPTESRYEKGGLPGLLDIIEIPLARHKPTSFQTENYLINDKYYWEQQGSFDLDGMSELCDCPEDLWGPDDSSYQGLNDRILQSLAAELDSSLYLISPDRLAVLVRVEGGEFGNPRRKIRARFMYGSTSYILPITDPDIERSYLKREEGTYPVDELNERVYMCVSLGLPYTDGFCYKFIASIIGL